MFERLAAGVILIGLAVAAVGTLFLEYTRPAAEQYYFLSTLAAYIAMITATVWAMFVYRKDVRKRAAKHRTAR